MKPDFFKNLPPEIITEIFLRLPVVSIPISKCVCKRWLDLLEPADFVKSHFARSAPALVVVGASGRLKVLELEGDLDLDLDPLTKYDFPYHQGKIKSCVNGLLVLRMHVDVDPRVRVDMLCVCNPITREVIKLDLPSDPQLSTSELSAYGFGASKITGRYKAVCIKVKDYDHKLDCHVYTLGTGSWRRLEGNPYDYHHGSGAFVNENLHWIATIGEESSWISRFDLETECFSFFKAPPYNYRHGPGAFVNGNLHWIATIGEESSWISCFDLETECFSFFKAPPYHAQGLPFRRVRSVSALSGCLWFCEEASEYEDDDDGGRCELTIWIMKEYGVDESWSKEYVIPLDDSLWLVDPIKVFENGDLLMLVMDLVYSISRCLFHYSNKNKTMQMIDLFGAGETSDRVECGLFTPTLVSLKTLGLGVENVISF